MITSRFEYGASVRVIRNIRNDGTFPGYKTGELLVRRGSVGHVRDVGTFLQDQVIYTIHFLDCGRTVGCRAEELIDAAAPWIPSRFEFRDRVRAGHHFSVKGTVVVAEGTEGEILKVLRGERSIAYHVRFPNRTLHIEEEALLPINEAEGM